MKTSLINEYEAFTEDGSTLESEFRDLVGEFIKSACLKYDSTQVEYILLGCLSTSCAFERAYNAVQKRKRKTNNA